MISVAVVPPAVKHPQTVVVVHVEAVAAADGVAVAAAVGRDAAGSLQLVVLHCRGRQLMVLARAHLRGHGHVAAGAAQVGAEIVIEGYLRVYEV